MSPIVFWTLQSPIDSGTPVSEWIVDPHPWRVLYYEGCLFYNKRKLQLLLLSLGLSKSSSSVGAYSSCHEHFDSKPATSKLFFSLVCLASCWTLHPKLIVWGGFFGQHHWWCDGAKVKFCFCKSWWFDKKRDVERKERQWLATCWPPPKIMVVSIQGDSSSGMGGQRRAAQLHYYTSIVVQ